MTSSNVSESRAGNGAYVLRPSAVKNLRGESVTGEEVMA